MSGISFFTFLYPLLRLIHTINLGEINVQKRRCNSIEQ